MLSNMSAEQAPIFFTKILHLFLASICVMFFGIVVSKNLNDIYPSSGKNTPGTKKSTLELMLHICLFTGLIYIAHFSVRNLMETLNTNVFSRVLFWSESINYDTTRLKELDGGIAVAYAVFLFMDKFKFDLFDLFDKRVDVELSSYLTTKNQQIYSNQRKN